MKIISYTYNISQKIVDHMPLGNLGDGIQTLAVIEFFKQKNIQLSGFIDRNNLQDDMFINGWHRYKNQNLPSKAIYCSLHTDKDHLLSIDKSIYIGCRDNWTSENCKSVGLQCSVTGCITINFPLSNETKQNVLYIDSIHDSTNHNYTQFISDNLSWEDHLVLAKNRLKLISTASLIYTTRLHVLIPCIAMGIPVCLDKIPKDKERFSHISKFIPINKIIELNSGIREELLEIWKKNTHYLDHLLCKNKETKDRS